MHFYETILNTSHLNFHKYKLSLLRLTYEIYYRCMKKLICILIFQALIFFAFADVRLPSVIGNNMVLQQNSLADLWGWSDPGEKILITSSWNNKTDSTSGTRDAKWDLKIQTPAAGGPFVITIKGRNVIMLTNVMIGEVWVCSGQSNMEFHHFYQGSKDIEPELKNPPNNNIHLFLVPRTTAQYPQEDCHAQWTVADSTTLKLFSEVAYFFAKKLNKNLNVPIGLIEASWGGTPAEVWTPGDAVNNDVVLKDASHKLEPSNWWPHWPGYTYNGMISPLTNYSIAGAIWYQGEGNTNNADTYAQLFTTMIKSWRTAGQKDFPFYYVQIAPYAYGNNFNGAIIREQQEKVLTLENTGMVVTTDITADTTNIHPPDKLDVGYRLAGLALAETYHQNISGYKSATFKSMSIDGSKVVIDFNDAEDGFIIKGDHITQLYMAGKDSIFYLADAKIQSNKLVVSAKNVDAPVAVRYEFSNAGIGNLFSKDGLPVAPFRTDNWKLPANK